MTRLESPGSLQFPSVTRIALSAAADSIGLVPDHNALSEETGNVSTIDSD